MEVVRGGTAVLRSEFIDYQGTAIDVTLNDVKIIQPNGVLYTTIAPGAVTRLSAGNYRFDFFVPSSADPGLWTIKWTATHPNDAILVGEEGMRVLEVNEISLSTVPSLRLLINEKVPEFGSPSDTRFSDNELALILERMGMSLHAAAAEAWYVKAGMFEMLIDVDESGSNRNLDQIFKHAISMGDRYTRSWKTEGDALAVALEGRVPGKAVSPWTDTPDPNVIYPFSGYEHTYTRYFPTARFMYSPAVMG